jgi:murein DD-endopeptidase MepM/ murein hydrolase activator NlpD
MRSLLLTAALAALIVALPQPASPRLEPAPATQLVGVPPAWDWPLDGVVAVIRGFSAPAKPWLPGHRGVDLAGRPGLDVRAAAAGTVAFSGSVAGRGVVSVDHGGGLRTTYEPVSALVQAGQRVARGEVLGTLQPGHAGCPLDACLHWGLRRGEVYLDPTVLAAPRPLRLKPNARPAGSGRRRAGRRRPRCCRSGPRPGRMPGHPRTASRPRTGTAPRVVRAARGLA